LSASGESDSSAEGTSGKKGKKILTKITDFKPTLAWEKTSRAERRSKQYLVALVRDMAGGNNEQKGGGDIRHQIFSEDNEGGRRKGRGMSFGRGCVERVK